MSRISWFDDKSQAPQIDQRARNLTTFIDALADGRIDDAELKAQEKRLTDLMKEVEPQLSDALHEKVTQLLCELTAYDLMRMLNEMQHSRQKTVFRG